jgi:hypothetical protein
MSADPRPLDHDDEPEPNLLTRHLPPVAELIVLSVALMLSGGVYLGAHLPVRPSLTPAIILLAAGGVATVVAVTMLVRIPHFAWKKFFLVAKWAFVSYLVIAGILAFVFIFDHTRGATLAVLLATLAVFAVDVPMVMAFTVARYDEASALPTNASA